ncbi:MAG: hypothetical protein AAFQ89_22660, partial [Cyanobacteria bacterium J06626_18]
MGDLSPAELEAIAQLLRQKTGDDSIEIAFFTEGSIKLVLNGSPEGLEKLQELFDSGELAEVLDDRPVESAHSLESNTTEARKARLIQVLRLYAESNNLALARDRTRELARELELELDRTRELELELELDQTRKLARDIVLERNLVLAGVRFLALGRDLDRELDRTRV